MKKKLSAVIKKTKKKLNFKKIFSKNKDDGFNIFEVVVIIFISVLFGIIVGCIISTSNLGLVGKEASEELQEVISTYTNIVDEYYEDVDEKDLMNAAISGMVSILNDPYSTYLDNNQTYNFNQSVDGEYVGLGITITWTDGDCTITEVVKDSPAEKAGLKVDDLIVAVDKNDITKSTLEEISQLLTGKKGTSVKLEVMREGERLKLEVTRDIIQIQSVFSSIKDNNIGYIKIDNFAANTFKQFEKELKKLEKKKIESLIIDVRCNTGGRLNQVNEILDMFLGKNVEIYRIETKGKQKKVYTTDKTTRNYPVVVLVDEGSASASEILASAFHDKYKKATIVGVTTYGKGSIQKAVELPGGSSLKYTTQRWLTSKGKSLQDKGLNPDVVIEQSKEYYDNPTDENDAQLQKALEVLNKKES